MRPKSDDEAHQAGGDDLTVEVPTRGLTSRRQLWTTVGAGLGMACLVGSLFWGARLGFVGVTLVVLTLLRSWSMASNAPLFDESGLRRSRARRLRRGYLTKRDKATRPQ